jgi:hypothetical protein
VRLRLALLRRARRYHRLGVVCNSVLRCRFCCNCTQLRSRCPLGTFFRRHRSAQLTHRNPRQFPSRFERCRMAMPVAVAVAAARAEDRQKQCHYHREFSARSVGNYRRTMYRTIQSPALRSALSSMRAASQVRVPVQGRLQQRFVRADDGSYPCMHTSRTHRVLIALRWNNGWELRQ